MRLINNVIDEYGIDKVLHFLVGALVTAVISIFGIVFFGFVGFLIATFISVLVVYILAFYKEKKDSVFDITDIKATMFGNVFILLLNIILFGIYAILNDL